MPATQTRRRSPRTVLLRMAADQDRAARIKELKDSRPDLTWQAIADFVGVTMRAAQAWAEKGEIAYSNAEKLAELFEVDVKSITRAPQTSPDLMTALTTTPDDLSVRLERLEQSGQRIEGMLEQLLETAFQRELEDADRQADPQEHGSGEGAGGSAASAKA